MNKRIVAKEWLVFIISLPFGILVFPTILTFLFTGELKELGDFYHELFSDRNFIPWLVAFAPYFLIQIIRASVWSIKQLK